MVHVLCVLSLYQRKYKETIKNRDISLHSADRSLDVLSNFYQSELEIYGVKHKSTEHAFPYTKAIRCGDVDAASRITAAEDALLDSQLGKNKSKLTSNGTPLRR